MAAEQIGTGASSYTAQVDNGCVFLLQHKLDSTVSLGLSVCLHAGMKKGKTRTPLTNMPFLGTLSTSLLLLIFFPILFMYLLFNYVCMPSSHQLFIYCYIFPAIVRMLLLPVEIQLLKWTLCAGSK